MESDLKRIAFDVSTYFIHDYNEIVKLKNTSFVNVEKFAHSSFRKILSEIRKNIMKKDKYVEFSMQEKIFSIFNYNNFTETNFFADQSLYISKERDLPDSNKILKCFINPISNLPGFLHGNNNVTIDIIIHINNILSEALIYNPITNETLHYEPSNGFYYNEYRMKQKDITNLNEASCNIIIYKPTDVMKFPKFITKLGYMDTINNLSNGIMNLISGKADFLINTNPQILNNDIYYQLIKNSGFEILILKDRNITEQYFNIEQKELENNEAIIIGNKRNLQKLF